MIILKGHENIFIHFSSLYMMSHNLKSSWSNMCGVKGGKIILCTIEMCVTCHMKIDAKNIGISIIMLFYICDLYLCLTKLCEFTVVFY